MTIDDIKRIIAPDEHRELELKKTTGESEDEPLRALQAEVWLERR